MQSQDRSKLLGTLKMSRLVPRVSVPIMFSMLIQALYNVVDSIFVSRFDPNGLTAVSLAAPFQMLMIALSTGMGTGINSLLSRRLGERNPEGARRGAWNGFFIEVAGSFLFLLCGLLLSGTIMRLVVSENLANAESILSMGTDYLTIVTVFSLGLFLSVYFERLLQATGNSTLSMVTQLCGAVTNIILDPIMIFGYLGCPRMGVSGAAIATVIGQFVSAGVGYLLNQKKIRNSA
jgi:Na+-driven multidrug efflux pump